jgi:hypothetical protein
VSPRATDGRDRLLVDSPEAVYEKRVLVADARFRDVSRRWNLVANLRLVIFIVGAGLTGWGFWDDHPLAVVSGLVALLVFAILVASHQRLARERQRSSILSAINRAAMARLRRDWDALPLVDPWFSPTQHPFARDLDLFGYASLFHLVATTRTPTGTETLRRWLLASADPETIRARQAAVADLAPRLDERQDLEFLGRQVETYPDPAPFLAWAEGPRWLARRPALRWAARLSVALLWILIAADVAGIVGPPLWLIPASINLVISQTFTASIHPMLVRTATQQRALLPYAGMMTQLCDASFEAPLLQESRAALRADGHDAPVRLRHLDRLAALVIPRGSLLYIPIQAMTLWDVHVLDALEHWQRDAGSRVRRWLEVIGEVEALMSFAGMAYDEPDWAYPDVNTPHDRFEAEGLAHPLLPRDRVANDVMVGPPGTFLLVTGSNMSGKSTLLRAIGTNAILAGAGAPVCAARLRMPPVTIGTSGHVEDSLTQGVSFFMAELQRLKQVVDLATVTREAGGQFLFLLDEILQGTNTAERQIAARRIIRHLIAQGAIGAVSTHDLSLADTASLNHAAHPIHFRETFATGPDGVTMSFDYLTREGIATSSNALRLMELVGLDIGCDEE